jgi:hypothetical protein
LALKREFSPISTDDSASCRSAIPALFVGYLRLPEIINNFLFDQSDNRIIGYNGHTGKNDKDQPRNINKEFGLDV